MQSDSVLGGKIIIPCTLARIFFFLGGGGFATRYLDTNTLGEILFLQTARTQTIKETICEEEEEEEEEEEKEEEGERKKSATEGEILLASFTD